MTKKSNTKFKKASGKTSPKITEALNTAVTIVSKVGEVAHWLGAIAFAVLAIFGFTQGTFPPASTTDTSTLQTLNTYGFETTLASGDVIDYTTVAWFSIGSAIIMAIMAMVFRNVYLITKATKDKTPFTQDNMRMIKELGIFFIAVPVVAMIFEIIIHFATGAETSSDSNGVILGLIMLYLTQIFAHGVELEDDVKDLV